MKRFADTKDDPVSTKRPRQDSPSDANSEDPFRPILARKATDILANGVDESGFIEGMVWMRWPLIGGHIQIKLEVVENGGLKRFEVKFSGNCPAFFDSIGLQFERTDVLQLSLKGAHVNAVTSTNAINLPLSLEYPDGVRMKFVKKKTPLASGVLVDIWHGEFRVSQRHVYLMSISPVQEGSFES